MAANPPSNTPPTIKTKRTIDARPNALPKIHLITLIMVKGVSDGLGGADIRAFDAG
jgi:hypothetical protein